MTDEVDKSTDDPIYSQSFLSEHRLILEHDGDSCEFCSDGQIYYNHTNKIDGVMYFECQNCGALTAFAMDWL